MEPLKTYENLTDEEMWEIYELVEERIDMDKADYRPQEVAKQVQENYKLSYDDALVAVQDAQEAIHNAEQAEKEKERTLREGKKKTESRKSIPGWIEELVMAIPAQLSKTSEKKNINPLKREKTQVEIEEEKKSAVAQMKAAIENRRPEFYEFPLEMTESTKAKILHGLLQFKTAFQVQTNLGTGEIVNDESRNRLWFKVKFGEKEKIVENADIKAIKIQAVVPKEVREMVPEAEKYLEELKVKEMEPSDPKVEQYKKMKEWQAEQAERSREQKEKVFELLPTVKPFMKKLDVKELEPTEPAVQKYKEEKTPKKSSVKVEAKEAISEVFVRAVQKGDLKELFEELNIREDAFENNLDKLMSILSQLRENANVLERPARAERAAEAEREGALAKAFGVAIARAKKAFDRVITILGDGKNDVAVTVKKVKSYGEKWDPKDPSSEAELKKVYSGIQLVEALTGLADEKLKNATKWITELQTLLSDLEGVDLKVELLKLPEEKKTKKEKEEAEASQRGVKKFASFLSWLSEKWNEIKDWFSDLYTGLDETAEQFSYLNAEVESY